MTQANPTLPKPIADALTLIHSAQGCATLAIGQLDRPEERDRVSASIAALRTMIDSAARYLEHSAGAAAESRDDPPATEATESEAKEDRTPVRLCGNLETPILQVENLAAVLRVVAELEWERGERTKSSAIHGIANAIGAAHDDLRTRWTDLNSVLWDEKRSAVL